MSVEAARAWKANICSSSSSSSDCTSSIMIVYLMPWVSRKTLTAWRLGKGTRTSMGEPGWAGPRQKSSWRGQEPALSQQAGEGPAWERVWWQNFPYSWECQGQRTKGTPGHRTKSSAIREMAQEAEWGEDKGRGALEWRPPFAQVRKGTKTQERGV